MKPAAALWGQRCPQTLVTSPHAFGPRHSLGWPATCAIMLFKAVVRSCRPKHASLRVPLGMANCVTNNCRFAKQDQLDCQLKLSVLKLMN